MPEIAPHPIGGAKTVYQYADRLAAKGHQVTLVHPVDSLLYEVRSRWDSDLAIAENPGAKAGNVATNNWYRSSDKVRQLVVPNLREEHLRGPYDVTIVNNQRTVGWAHAFGIGMGLRIYFLQDYESYQMGEPARRDQIRKTLKLDWPIICTSTVVQALVRSVSGRQCHLIRKGIDDPFRLAVSIDSEERSLIGFPARAERSKRTLDAVRALEIVRAEISSRIGFWCFGYRHFSEIPNWVDHHIAPDDGQLSRLYNRSRIFLVPSEHEGFGLPGAEAMACGAALISTRNGGVDTYAAHDHSAILCPVGQPESMAAAIMRLMNNDELRRRLGSNGATSMSDWTLDESLRQFENVLLAETQ